MAILNQCARILICRQVDQNLLIMSKALPTNPGSFFAHNLGNQRQTSDLEIIHAPCSNLPILWNECIRGLEQATLPIQDELRNAECAHVCIPQFTKIDSS